MDGPNLMTMTFEYEPGAPRCAIRLTGEIDRDDLTAGIEAQVAAGAWTCETVIDTTAATGIRTHYPDAESSPIRSREPSTTETCRHEGRWSSP
jgi:hypothetical protein